LPLHIWGSTSLPLPLGRLHTVAAATAGPEPPSQAGEAAHDQPVVRPEDQQGEGIAKAEAEHRPATSSSRHGVHEAQPAATAWSASPAGRGLPAPERDKERLSSRLNPTMGLPPTPGLNTQPVATAGHQPSPHPGGGDQEQPLHSNSTTTAPLPDATTQLDVRHTAEQRVLLGEQGALVRPLLEL